MLYRVNLILFVYKVKNWSLDIFVLNASTNAIISDTWLYAAVPLDYKVFWWDKTTNMAWLILLPWFLGIIIVVLKKFIWLQKFWVNLWTCIDE